MLLPLLRATLALAGLGLIAATRHLWFGRPQFPVIPLVPGLTDVPWWVDSMFSTLLTSSLLLLLWVSLREMLMFAGRWRAVGDDSGSVQAPQRSGNGDRRISDGVENSLEPVQAGLIAPKLAARLSIVIVCSGLVLVMLNQHRLQPWLFHLMLQCPVLAVNTVPTPGRMGSRDARVSIGLLIFLTAGIYFWSGVSKCDGSFLEGHGQTFLSAIADSLGVSLRFWSPPLRRFAAMLLPAGELAVALGLIIPKTRRHALRLSLVMHCLLITALGPWGLNQRPGVLLWNAQFLLQNLLLLRAEATVKKDAGVAGRSWRLSDVWARPDSRLLRCGRLAAGLAILLPALRPIGWYDHWPSWAVYAAGTGRARLLIARQAVDDLPPEVRRFCQPRILDDHWAWLRIDQWSLAAVDAPVYPQTRFTVACGLAVSGLCSRADAIRVITDAQPTAQTVRLQAASGSTQMELKQASRRFLLNVRPRRTWPSR